MIQAVHEKWNTKSLKYQKCLRLFAQLFYSTHFHEVLENLHSILPKLLSLKQQDENPEMAISKVF